MIIPLFLPTAAFQRAAVFAFREVFICTFAIMRVCGYNVKQRNEFELSHDEMRLMREALLAHRQ